MLLVCSSRSQQLPHNIVWGEGALKGQARWGGGGGQKGIKVMK